MGGSRTRIEGPGRWEGTALEGVKATLASYPIRIRIVEGGGQRRGIEV